MGIWRCRRQALGVCKAVGNGGHVQMPARALYKPGYA